METGLLVLFAILLLIGLGLMGFTLFHLFFHVKIEELKRKQIVLEEELGIIERKSNPKLYLIMFWAFLIICIGLLSVKYYIANSENSLRQMEVKVK